MVRVSSGVGETGSEDYRYTGKHEDPSGLYYYGARYYDLLTGRFTTRDTVFGELGDPQSQNRYVYCRNNPEKYVDPDGRMLQIAGMALVGAGSNVAFYFIEHALTGERINGNEIAMEILTGASTGAIAGATMGMSILLKIPVDFLSNVIIDEVGDLVLEQKGVTRSDSDYNPGDAENLLDVSAETASQIEQVGDVLDVIEFDDFDFSTGLIYKSLTLLPIVYERVDYWYNENYSQDTNTQYNDYYDNNQNLK